MPSLLNHVYGQYFQSCNCIKDSLQSCFVIMFGLWSKCENTKRRCIEPDVFWIRCLLNEHSTKTRYMARIINVTSRMAHVHKIHTFHSQACTLMPVGNADQTFTGLISASPYKRRIFHLTRRCGYKISLPLFRQTCQPLGIKNCILWSQKLYFPPKNCIL